MKLIDEDWHLSSRQARYSMPEEMAAKLRAAGLPTEFEAISIGNGVNGPQVAIIPLDESSIARAKMIVKTPAALRSLKILLDKPWFQAHCDIPAQAFIEELLEDAGVLP